MPISCALDEIHASEVLGYSSVSASEVEQNAVECFSEIFFGNA